MTLATLLTDLTARGVEFQINGDKLRFRPAEQLTSDELETIRQHKQQIVELLRTDGGKTAPIVPGTEHFALWVDSPDGPWPEFIPGFHYDIRQPSRLQGLLTPRTNN